MAVEFFFDGQLFDSAQMIVVHTPDPRALCVMVSRDYHHAFIVSLDPQTGVTVRRAEVQDIESLVSKLGLQELAGLVADLRARRA